MRPRPRGPPRLPASLSNLGVATEPLRSLDGFYELEERAVFAAGGALGFAEDLAAADVELAVDGGRVLFQRLFGGVVGDHFFADLLQRFGHAAAGLAGRG